MLYVNMLIGYQVSVLFLYLKILIVCHKNQEQRFCPNQNLEGCFYQIACSHYFMSKNQDEVSKYILEFSLLFCFMESLEFYWSLKLERKWLENIGFAEKESRNLDLPRRLLTFICSKSYNVHGFFFFTTNWGCWDVLRQLICWVF